MVLIVLGVVEYENRHLVQTCHRPVVGLITELCPGKLARITFVEILVQRVLGLLEVLMDVTAQLILVVYRTGRKRRTCHHHDQDMQSRAILMTLPCNLGMHPHENGDITIHLTYHIYRGLLATIMTVLYNNNRGMKMKTTRSSLVKVKNV